MPSPKGKKHPPHYPICKKFLYWLMNEVVLRTIKVTEHHLSIHYAYCRSSFIMQTYFYVTDSTVHHNKMFYYRKELWKMVEKLAVKERKDSLFSLISEVRFSLNSCPDCIYIFVSLSLFLSFSLSIYLFISSPPLPPSSSIT